MNALGVALSLLGLLRGPSSYQKQLFSETAAIARRASAAARPELLAFLDRPDFRAELGACCADIADEPAEALLDKLVAETRALEVVSGVPVGASPFSFSFYTSLDLAMTNDVLDCDWVTGVRSHLHWSSFSSFPFIGEWLHIQDHLEMEWYGLKPFSVPAAPTTLAEARERISYFQLNDARADAGSPLYGPVSLVLDTDAVARGSIVSAVDSGEWARMCNHTFQFDVTGYVNNCSGYSPPHGSPLGTLDDFTHLFLPNTHYWNYTSAARYMARRFQRLLYPWKTPLQSGVELIHYFEVAPIMPLPFATTHKFVIGGFPELFGSGNGTNLRTFADKWKLPLVWSLGLNLGRQYMFFDVARVPGPLAMDQRILDGLSAHSNATHASAVGAVFDKYWTKARALRAAGGLPSQWATLWSELVAELPRTMQLLPLMASSCANFSKCIGVNLDNDCVCRV